MFWVNGNQEERHAKINSFLNEEEAVIAVLLAAADFEWTIRRVIIALSRKPNVDVRKQILKNCSSIRNYKEAWKSEVTPDFEKTLPEIIPDWDYFYKDAYLLRHKLIHGVEGTTGLNYARTRVNSILAAAKAIADFAKENKYIDIYNRLPVKKKKSCKPPA